jgi:hypothetical protein
MIPIPQPTPWHLPGPGCTLTLPMLPPLPHAHPCPVTARAGSSPFHTCQLTPLPPRPAAPPITAHPHPPSYLYPRPLCGFAYYSILGSISLHSGQGGPPMSVRGRGRPAGTRPQPYCAPHLSGALLEQALAGRRCSVVCRYERRARRLQAKARPRWEGEREVCCQRLRR